MIKRKDKSGQTIIPVEDQERPKLPVRDTQAILPSISAREGLLDAAKHVVDELGRRAKGEVYNEHINLSDQIRIMDYAIPIIQQGQDRVDLGNLAKQTPEERTNTILEAVARGQMTVKNAMDLVAVMKGLNELSNPQADESGKLIINLTGLEKVDDVRVEKILN